MKDLLIAVLILFIVSYGDVIFIMNFEYEDKKKRLQQVGIVGIITIVTLVILFAIA